MLTWMVSLILMKDYLKYKLSLVFYLLLLFTIPVILIKNFLAIQKPKLIVNLLSLMKYLAGVIQELNLMLSTMNS